jgi:hypothetical protein
VEVAADESVVPDPGVEDDVGPAPALRVDNGYGRGGIDIVGSSDWALV